MQTMKGFPGGSRRLWLLAGAILLLLVPIILFFRHSELSEPDPPANEAPSSPAITTLTSPRSEHGDLKDLPVNGAPDSSERLSARDLFQRIEEARIILSDSPEPGAVHSTLRSLHTSLQAANPAAAAAAIVQGLDSGDDAETSQAFQVGPGGALVSAPTLRCFLLDLLGQFDPVESPRYSSTIFSEARSPDEWALAMRNLAWSNTGGDYTLEIQSRFSEMLDRENWLAQPSGGLLEALDFGVYLGNRKSFADVAGLIGHEPDNRGGPLSHAAFIALDRILVGNRKMGFSFLDSEPDLLSWAPEHRAALLARADVTDQLERRVVESYLTRTDLGPDEAKAFFELFPNRNYSAGHRLASIQEKGMAINQVAETDLATLNLVRQWRQDTRFVTHQESLADLQQVLEKYEADIQTARREERQSPIQPPIVDPVSGDGAGFPGK